MGKKKKKSFSDRHPFITFVGLPIITPFYVGKAIYDGCKESRCKHIDSMSGLEYEKYVASKLSGKGFKKIELTPGSGDFGADIIAKDKHGKKVCIQCKKYKSNVGVSAVQEVIAATKYYECDYGMVITSSTFTPAAKKMATQTSVILSEGFI